MMTSKLVRLDTPSLRLNMQDPSRALYDGPGATKHHLADTRLTPSFRNWLQHLQRLLHPATSPIHHPQLSQAIQHFPISPQPPERQQRLPLRLKITQNPTKYSFQKVLLGRMTHIYHLQYLSHLRNSLATSPVSGLVNQHHFGHSRDEFAVAKSLDIRVNSLSLIPNNITPTNHLPIIIYRTMHNINIPISVLHWTGIKTHVYQISATLYVLLVGFAGNFSYRVHLFLTFQFIHIAFIKIYYHLWSSCMISLIPIFSLISVLFLVTYFVACRFWATRTLPFSEGGTWSSRLLHPIT